MATLAEIRARLTEQAAKSGGSTQSGDNGLFAHWNIPEGTSAVIRFLPDGDESNTFFWRERLMMRFEFPGIKGQDENRKCIVQVPCVDMWGESCPIHAQLRPWFNDPSMEQLARKYWKKRSYVFQGLIVSSPMDEDNVPENPVRRMIISPQIFTIIKSALMDVEMEEIPTDYERGTDFRINKTQKGGYADYSTSSWARKERSLNEEELEAVSKHGLFNLDQFMPKRPGKEEVDIQLEMFEASVDGKLYDPERWGNYYRPNGATFANSTSATNPAPATPVATAPATPVAEAAPVATPAVAPAPSPVEAPDGNPSTAEAPATGEKKPSVDDILSMIRNRETTGQ
ncbi:hypothetical protein N9V27_00175 [bacterium]|nr:hypothetical protein [bacterium]